MKRLLLIVMIAFIGFQVQAQRFLTKNGEVSLYSKTPFETIEALNNQVNCALDSKTSDIVFRVLMKSFEFKRALMQEHFNENYVESDKYPDAMFKGKVTNLKSIDFPSQAIQHPSAHGNIS